MYWDLYRWMYVFPKSWSSSEVFNLDNSMSEYHLCRAFEALWLLWRISCLSSLAHQKRITCWNIIDLTKLISAMKHVGWKESTLYFSSKYIPSILLNRSILSGRGKRDSLQVRTIVAFHCISEDFAVTMPLSKLLQKKQLDIEAARDALLNTIQYYF